MHPIVASFVRRTVVGSVVIAVAVPMLQHQVFALAQSHGPALSVTGDVTGLSTGQLGRLALTVHNEGDAPAAVRRITTSVREQRTGCTLSVAPWSGAMDVPAGGAVTRDVVVRISGHRCAGARWTLEYAATP